MRTRVESAVKYLKALENSLQAGWLKLFKMEGKTIFELLAMLHPLHFKELDLPQYLNIETIQRSLQGPRAFTSTLGGNSCQSAMIWGYNCELSGEIQQDHLFPYSLGGPTLAVNRIFLCTYHNMVKTSDIHCYPWESTDILVQPWLDSQIRRLHSEVYSLYG